MGPWGDDVMTMTAPIRYAYDPESAESRFMHKHVYGRWRSLTDLFGISVMLVFLWLIVRIAVRESGTILGDIGPAFEQMAPMVFWAGIVLGLAAAFACGLLVERLHSTLTDADKERTVFGRGPIHVVLDEEGIHTETPYVSQIISWDSVTAVVPNRQGVGLRLDRSHFIPVIDVQLPQGTTRDDVLAAIAAWRGRAARS